MFDIGGFEIGVLAIVVVVGLVWLGWRQRWVSIAGDWVLPLPAEDVERVVTDSLAAVPRTTLRAQGPGAWVYSVERAPGWAIFFGILTFPFGLLLILLVKERADLHIWVEPVPEGCRVRIVGRSVVGNRRALESWLDRMSGLAVV